MPGIAVFAVSVYLLFVGAWLLIARRVPGQGLRKIPLSRLRKPYAAPVRDVKAEVGRCFTAPMPARLLSDRESFSSLVLFEDGREMGPAHSSHEEIRRLGQGRFSHWGAALYFSTPDDSDPRTNGRQYQVKEVRK